MVVVGERNVVAKPVCHGLLVETWFACKEPCDSLSPLTPHVLSANLYRLAMEFTALTQVFLNVLSMFLDDAESYPCLTPLELLQGY